MSLIPRNQNEIYQRLPEIEQLRLTVYGLLNGIAKMAGKEKSLHNRIVMLDAAIQKRKKQNIMDHKQIEDLFESLYENSDKNKSFKEFRTGWLTVHGYINSENELK